MKEDPQDLVDQVCDEASFLRFLIALGKDWDEGQAQERVAPCSPYGPGANGWENPTIGGFLEAVVAWADDMSAERWAQMSGDPTPQQNAWRRVAHMLLAGKYYE
jgi:hypothetical protein